MLAGIKAQRQWEIGYWVVKHLVAVNQNHTDPARARDRVATPYEGASDAGLTPTGEFQNISIDLKRAQGKQTRVPNRDEADDVSVMELATS